MASRDALVLIYDGACDFCRGGKNWIERRAIPGTFEFLPCQSRERQRRFPAMKAETCLEAMQLVLPDGRILAGDQAIPEVLKRLQGWRWAAILFLIPGIHLLAGPVYRWVARNRYAISCMIRHRK